MYSFLVEALQPHTLLCVWALAALVWVWWRRNAPRRRLWPLYVPLLLLAVLCMPATAHLATWPLEASSRPLGERPADAPAIVVFAAGVRPPVGVRVRPEMDEDTLARCLEAARLYKQGAPCIVVASGGTVDADEPGPSYAAVMADFLHELGVQESGLVREEKSRTTYENAVESAKLLKEKGVTRAVLVVDAVDMPRAAACLRKQGVEVVPAPCHFRAVRFRLTLFAFLPQPGGAMGVERVWHEWLGLAWYWCAGRL